MLPYLTDIISGGGLSRFHWCGVCVCVCVVAQLCLTVCDPMDYCSPPDSSVHGILQTRILEWVAIPFSRGSSRPRNQTQVSCVAGRFFTSEPPGVVFPLVNYSLKKLQTPLVTITNSIGKLLIKKIFKDSDWPSQDHLKTLDQSPKAQGTEYVLCVPLNMSIIFRNEEITVI